MNVLESMAAGLAHEINQPLTAAVAYLQSSRRLLAIAPERRPAGVADTLEKAATQVARAGQIVTRLREFIAHGEPDKTSVRLHEVVLDAFDAAQIGARAGPVTTILRLEAENDAVLADRIQIEQVLVNLMRNAEEAMGASERRELLVVTSSDAEEMTIAISDTGVGLPDMARKSLFEPFSTTKPNGMGVGLSISRAIVEAHHGRLWAEPGRDGGAVFKFTLPVKEVAENGLA
jgi:C4-dicarboxylate-specific signal transduction histidine kinase